MDPRLEKAAEYGDVKFLKKMLAKKKPSKYFLALNDDGKSFFRVAWGFGKTEFMKEAMKILPKYILKQLLLITNDDSCNTLLHAAAYHYSTYKYKLIFKCIREMYSSLSTDYKHHYVKPWLALNKDNHTPLSLTLKMGRMDEERAMEILLLDRELESCTITDKDGNSPLYYAVKNGYNLVALKILKSSLPSTSILGSTNFLSLVRLATKCSGNVVKLLLVKCGDFIDNDGNTPLHSALQSTSTQELALETLSTYPTFRKICNDKGESPFFLAVRSGYERVVDEIMRIEEQRFHMLRCNDGTTVLHCLSSCSEKTGQMLLDKYWWLNNLQDYQGKTALDHAKQEKADWLVNLLTNPSLIKKQDFDWVEACKREETDAVLAFASNCEDLRPFCKENDTPLHHAKLATCKDYINFLKIPSIAELKNTTDHDGATPLHVALEREDMNFAKALLLDARVKRLIRDRTGTTSMDLLAQLCKENDDWEKMCKEIKVNPYLRTTYILPGTNLEQMRTTLSVIAALLATITFAAGFTLPGGISNDNGQALLGKKAAFLVFLLADAYAMCTSMLVLFCLVWSMVSEPDMASLLVDRSVFILMQSLYATLLVFMTDIYVVIEHTSLWAAIVIFVMCSIIGITANKTILHKVIAMLVPAAYREKLDQMRLLEEGNAGAFTTEEENADKRE